MLKKTTDQFIEDSRRVWGDRWDYSCSEYVNAKTKIQIKCPKHGVVFEQAPRKHLSEQVGCSLCGGGRGKMTTELFILKSKEAWGDRWDYSSTEYANTSTPLTFICPDHGPFTQTYSNHLASKLGCSGCLGYTKGVDGFLELAKEVWGDRWDYSNIDYKDRNIPIVITCRIHGNFKQSPRTHLSGAVGCSSCSMESRTSEFLNKAREVWGDKWDYSNLNYKGARKDVTVTCPDHGEFTQLAYKHLDGIVGCYACGGNVMPSSQNYLDRAKKVWGSRWEYGSSSASQWGDCIEVQCPKHGEFYQRLGSHLQGKVGCPECRYAESRMSSDVLLSKAQEVWGDRWDYSNTSWDSGSSGTYNFICREHGEFEQTYSGHIMGRVGCSKCHSSESRQGEDILLARALEVWGDRWDYTYTRFDSGSTGRYLFTCPEHGSFYQDYYSHIAGAVGCSGCIGRMRKAGPDQLLSKAHEVWGDRWDYSESVLSQGIVGVYSIFRCRLHGPYTQSWSGHLAGLVGCSECVNSSLRVSQPQLEERIKGTWQNRWDYSKTDWNAGLRMQNTIICPDHGEFHQTLERHLLGRVGCKSCASAQTSKGEQEILEFVQSLGVEVEWRSHPIEDDRTEIDIYVPGVKVGIEFNGLYWHSEKFKSKDYHYTKFKIAENAGIKLIQIWEDDWNLRKDIWKNHISQVLGVSKLERVAARKTSVEEVGYTEYLDFLNSYHVQGVSSASLYLGLRYQGAIVAVAGFKRRGQDYELVRYATSVNVQGGHSKLVSYMERTYEYDNLITFADLTFGNGNLYRVTGWVEDSLLKPDYMYVVRGERKHKFGYRLKKFRQDPSLKYQEGMTERELAQLNNMPRIYDAGKIRFIKPHP